MKAILTQQLIYFIPTLAMVIWAGYQCYKHGAVYIMELFEGQSDLAITLNKVLLLGYYLVNIGLLVYTLMQGERQEFLSDLISQQADRVGVVALLLGVLHFINILGLNLLKRSKFLKP